MSRCDFSEMELAAPSPLRAVRVLSSPAVPQVTRSREKTQGGDPHFLRVFVPENKGHTMTHLRLNGRCPPDGPTLKSEATIVTPEYRCTYMQLKWIHYVLARRMREEKTSNQINLRFTRTP